MSDNVEWTTIYYRIVVSKVYFQAGTVGSYITLAICPNEGRLKLDVKEPCHDQTIATKALSNQTTVSPLFKNKMLEILAH